MPKNTNSALYEKIRNDFIEKIENDFYSDYDKLPSETQITKLYSVSRITATKALNELMLEGFISRVQGKGSYVIPKAQRITALASSPSSKSLLKTHYHRIGVLMPQIFDYHSVAIIESITKTLTYPDFFTATVCASSIEAETFTIDTFIKQQYDGIIVFPQDSEYYNEVILELDFNNYPIIVIDRLIPGIKSCSIISNNDISCKMALDHLFSLGHSRIAFVSSSSVSEMNTLKRQSSFISYLSQKNNGLSGCYSYVDMDQNPSFADDFIPNVKNGNITAVIAGNVDTTNKLLQLCENENISFPDDLSIISYDKPYMTNISFTYIEQGSYEMGFAAANALINMLNKVPTTQSNKIITVKPSLVVGKTTDYVT